MLFEAYSDGASGRHSGMPGGWGWVLCVDRQVVACDYGGSVSTTNNVMELTAGIRALKHVKNLWTSPNPVVLISDSQLVLGLASGKMHAEKNVELANEIRDLLQSMRGTVRWVRGHQLKKSVPWESYSQDVLCNHKCDLLAGLGKSEAGRSDMVST